MIIPMCRDVALALARGEWDDGPWHVRLRLRGHLAVCYFCRRYQAQLRWLDRMLKSAWTMNKDRQRVDALKRRVKQTLGV